MYWTWLRNLSILLMVAGPILENNVRGMDFMGSLMLWGGLALGIYAFLCYPVEDRRWAARFLRLRRCYQIGVVLLFVSFACIEGLIVAHSYTKPYTGDYLIVLGAGIYGEEPSASLISRLETARLYLEDHPQAIAILSGGQGKGEDITEAEAMRRYLVERDIADGRLWLDHAARNTRQNLSGAKSLMCAKLGGKTVQAAIVTNDFHQYRAQALARQMGLDTVSLVAPTPDVPGLAFSCYVREYFAVVKFYLESWRGK